MSDDYKGEAQIYQLFSQCLKVFKKRMLLLCKISSSDPDQSNLRLESNLSQTIIEGITLLKKFEEIQQNDNNIQIIFSRFLLRVRESVHTIALMTSASEVVNFLNFLENIIKQFNFSTNIRLLLKIILTKNPKNFINNYIPQTKSIRRNSSDQNLTVINFQLQKNKSKSQTNFDSFDKYIQALDRQYRLFQCLNIQKSQYRRTFFLALEDLQRKDSNLLQEMLYRNRCTQQSLRAYERNYDRKVKKIGEKKVKLFKTQHNIQIEQLDGGETHPQKNIFKLKQKYQQNNLESFSAPKRMKSEYYSKNQRRSNVNVPMILDINNLENRNLKALKERIKTSYHMASQQSYQVSHVERRSLPKNIHIMPLKKVHFRGVKIQLAPQRMDKKNSLLSQQQRKRKFYKKTQQHFRKKVSFITQPRASKLQQIRQSPKKATFKSIRIQFNRIIQ